MGLAASVEFIASLPRLTLSATPYLLGIGRLVRGYFAEKPSTAQFFGGKCGTRFIEILLLK